MFVGWDENTLLSLYQERCRNGKTIFFYENGNGNGTVTDLIRCHLFRTRTKCKSVTSLMGQDLHPIITYHIDIYDSYAVVAKLIFSDILIQYIRSKAVNHDRTHSLVKPSQLLLPLFLWMMT